MRARCFIPSTTGFENYGGRGITVCERWLSFDAFLEDMGERPAGMSIERIDNNKGYSKENCRWATKAEQNRNTSLVRRITYQGKTQCLAEWAREKGLEFQVLWFRLRNGWSVEDALNRPVLPRLNGRPKDALGRFAKT